VELLLATTKFVSDPNDGEQTELPQPTNPSSHKSISSEHFSGQPEVPIEVENAHIPAGGGSQHEQLTFPSLITTAPLGCSLIVAI
jgi:hypothetical protein